MKQLAIQGPARRLLNRLHRWSGLALLAMLFIAGATGGILTFREDLERWLNPHLRVVEAAAARAPLHEVVDRVERRFPGARVSTVTLPPTAQDTLIVYLSPRPGSGGGALDASDVFVNPYSGEILGSRNRRSPLLSTENLVPTLIRLHYSVLLETPGVWLMGGAAAVWLMSGLIGLALAWPVAWRRVAGWRPMVWVRWSDGAYKVNYDLHRALGVGLLPVWLVLAFSSVYLNFPGPVRTATAAFAAVSTPPARTVATPVLPVITPDAAIATAVAALPGSRPFGFSRDFRNGWYSVRLVAPGDIDPAGSSRAYVDFATGKVAAVESGASASAGDRFLDWQFPLHSGEAFGLPGRLAITAAAAALVAMCVSGLYVWWRGWVARRRRTAARPALSSLDSPRTAR